MSNPTEVIRKVLVPESRINQLIATYFDQVHKLMHDRNFLGEAALASHLGYAARHPENFPDGAPSEISEAERDANLAGFIALQEAVAIIANKEKRPPVEVLKRISLGLVDYEDWYLLTATQKTSFVKAKHWTGEALVRDLQLVDGSGLDDRREDFEQIVDNALVLLRHLEVKVSMDRSTDGTDNFAHRETYVEKKQSKVLARIYQLMNDPEFLTQFPMAADRAYKAGAVKSELVQGVNDESEYNWLFVTNDDGRVVNEQGQIVDPEKPLTGDNFPALTPLFTEVDLDKLQSAIEDVQAVYEENYSAEDSGRAARQAAMAAYEEFPDEVADIFAMRNINTAGLFATINATLHIANTEQMPILTILQDLVSVNSRYMSVAMRFAHASWYVDQPWRDREFRDIVKPFDKLTQEEIDLDKVQIIKGAEALLAGVFGIE
jgi:hypothetical protein